MKNVFLFFVMYLSLVSFSFDAIASEKQKNQIKDEDIICFLLSLDVPDIETIKQTRDYWMISLDVIEKIDELKCTELLNYFARTNQEKNILHFFRNNNVQKRNEAMNLLGWKNDGDWKSDKDKKALIQAHCVGVNGMLESEWRDVYKNNIALKMIYLSSNPNVADEYGNTLLIWAAGAGQIAIVKALLNLLNVDVNAKNNDGDTALLRVLQIADCCAEAKEIEGLLTAERATLLHQNVQPIQPTSFPILQMWGQFK